MSLELTFKSMIEELSRSGILEGVYAHFYEELPNECVGIIWNDGQIDRLINQARSPERFSVGLPQLAEVLGRRAGTVSVIYHSHPGGTTGLSVEDRMSMAAQFNKGIPIPWLVVTETRATLYFLEEHGEIGYVAMPRNGLVHV